MADKIAEILNYGSLQKVKEVGSDEKTIVLELFNRSKYGLFKQQNLLLDTQIDFLVHDSYFYVYSMGCWSINCRTMVLSRFEKSRRFEKSKF